MKKYLKLTYELQKNFDESLKTKKIFNEIDKINIEKLDSSLESKIIISIKIRHEAEIFMKKILWDELVSKISWNQTWEMIKNNQRK